MTRTEDIRAALHAERQQQISDQQRRELRAAHGAERVREAIREENTGTEGDRIDVVVGRARDAQRIAAARLLGAERRAG